jgi:hypothetical protein
VISGFSREAEENCALLGYYAASSGNFLPTFRDNLCSAALMNSFPSIFSQSYFILFYISAAPNCVVSLHECFAVLDFHTGAILFSSPVL